MTYSVPAVVLGAVALIEESAENFVSFFKYDCRQMLELHRAVADNHDLAGELIPRIHALSYSIKSRAGMFGYECASLIAGSLNHFTRRSPAQNLSPYLLVVEKHLESLGIILHQDIKGLGGAIGQELLQKLTELTKKFG